MLTPKLLAEIELQLLHNNPWACGLTSKLCKELLADFKATDLTSYSEYLITCFLFLLEAHDAADT